MAANVETPDIETTATELRNAYAEQMGRLGVAYLGSAEFEPMGALATNKRPADWQLWRSLAKKVIKAELNPQTFIDAQYVACGDAKGRTLQLQELVKDFLTASNRYWQQVPRTDVAFQQQSFDIMESQLGVLEHRLVPMRYRDINVLLLDPMLPFTSCFRVLQANSHLPTYPKLLEIYGEDAQTQYQTDIGLRNFLEEKKDAYPVSRCRGDL